MQQLSETEAINAQATSGDSSAAAEPIEAALGSDRAERLTRLTALRTNGVVTEEEFAAQKAKILGAV
jgi:hypothetical protein